MRRKLSSILCLILAIACAGCQLLHTPQPPGPFQHSFVREQLVLHSDFPLPQQHRLIEQLTLQRGILCEKLKITPTDEPIHIYLFADDTAYYEFVTLRFPDYASRRAIFVETDVELSVYAHWGDHVAEDLRHEVVHGYLHSVIPNIPLWLDEGLAEYFEVSSRKGLNQPHLDLLNAQAELANWKPDLRRLEQLPSAADMTSQDYAEAWAWVHYLLESNDKSHLLTDYLADLRQGNTETNLSARLEKRLAAPELAMIEHLQILR